MVPTAPAAHNQKFADATKTDGRKNMSEKYKSMWESLGLDLEAHDALLDV